jgi:hypothetical protein
MARGFRDDDRSNADTTKLKDVQAIRATEKALLCRIEGEEHWVPQSQITEDSEVYEPGDEGTLVVMTWWAEKNNLE